MRNLRHLLSFTVLLGMVFGLGIQSLQAKDKNQHLIAQVLDDSEGMLPGPAAYARIADWQDLKVMKVRKLGAEDHRGSFKFLYELDLSGNLTRLETADGLVRNFYYNENDDLLSVEIFENTRLQSQIHYYYNRDGLYKSAELDLASGLETETLYDKKGYPETIVVYRDGLVSDSWKVENEYDSKGNLLFSKGNSIQRSYTYDNNGNLIKFTQSRLNANQRAELTYEEGNLASVKSYIEDGGDYKLQSTLSYTRNSLGMIAKESIKYRDPNAMPVSFDYIYDNYWEAISSTRGDVEEDGFPGYGTPLVLSWMNPIINTQVTDSIFDIKVEVRPGPGQEMPDIKGMTIRHNGDKAMKEVGKVYLEQSGKGNTYTFEKRMYLKEGMNTIDVEALTKLGSFYSGQRHVEYLNPNRAIRVNNLHILAIGISDYEKDQFDLQFADQDASDLAGVFRGQEGKLYDQVKIQTLTNEQATKENIETAVRKLRGRVTDRDLSIIFFSGHGATDDGEYYFLPRCTEKCDGPLDKVAINNRWMMEQVARFDGPLLYFFDGCHTSPLDEEGKPMATTNLDIVRQTFDEAVHRKDRLKILMMAAQKENQSRESGWWKNGAFAEALVEGLQGGADEMGDNNGYVNFKELNEYVTWRVNELTEGAQVPYSLTKGVGMVSLMKLKE